MNPTRLLHTILILILAPTLWASSETILTLYHSQLRNNRFDANLANLRRLMQTAPADSLITEYMQRGHAVALDSISLFSYFNGGPVVPTKEEREQLLDRIYAAARRHNSPRLRVTADFFRAFMSLGYREDHFNLTMDAYEAVVSQARRVGEPYIELLALREMWFSCNISSRYARGFAYAQRYEQALDRAGDDIPYRGRAYIELARSYYHTGDADRSLAMMRRALRLGGDYQMENVTAWNYLAVNHLQKHNLDSAEWYNRTIIASREALENRSVHLGIAITNLGRIQLARSNYTEAIALMNAGLACMKQYNEPSFIVGLYISLGHAWLGRGNTARTKSYIDSAYVALQPFDDENRQLRTRDLFRLENAYYTRLGDYRRAAIALDSMIRARDNYQRYVGRHNVLLGEQRLQAAEIELQSAEVARQRQIILATIAALLLITAALLLILSLYRKRNAAYRKLAHQARQWALPDSPVPAPDSVPAPVPPAEEPAPPGDNPKGPPNDEDLRIMALVEAEMTERHAYRESGLSSEELADRLGIHRNLLARAIGRCTGGNFSNYVNGLRVREAIRILSSSSRRDLYIEEVSERVGFGNRNTFTRVFKQFTGITPLEYQRQVETQESEK